MASSEVRQTVVDNKNCKRCGNVARSGVQCVKCKSLIHAGCAKYVKNLKRLDDNTVLCCEADESINSTMDLTIRPEKVEDTEDDCSECSFCSVNDIIEADVSTKDILMLRELIKHKNMIIKSQQKTINSLAAQVSMMSGMIHPATPMRQCGRSSDSSADTGKVYKSEMSKKQTTVPQANNSCSNTTTGVAGQQTVVKPPTVGSILLNQ
nr:unnamed protein product [Callosobruchus analis]